MPGNLQPLDQKFAIVGADGRPTDYFTRWAQQKQQDIVSSITEQDLLDYLIAHKLKAGLGIHLTPTGNLSDSPQIDADIQALLDSISSTRGSILYRGAGSWFALAPGTSGQYLQTLGAGADPAWATVSATGAAWGSITGILSAQTDLQTALNGKAANTLFTAIANGLAPASGGGTANFLRADGSWATPPNTTYSIFTSTVAGLAPASGGGTTNYLRADGSWAAPPGTVYSNFTAVAAGLTPASGGGTTNFLRADGSWAVPPGVSTVFTAVANGLAPASGGGTANFLRADGNWAVPTGTAKGSIFPIDAPPFGSFTWMNQGTSTFTTNSDGSVTLIAQAAASQSVRGVFIPLAAGVFEKRIGFIAPMQSTGFQICGVALRDSVSGKFILFGNYRDASASCLFVAMNFPSATGTQTNVNVPATPSNWTHSNPTYVHLKDDGTTRTVSIGLDPWLQPFLGYSQPTGTFITPDQIGLCYMNTSGSAGYGLTCFDWQ